MPADHEPTDLPNEATSDSTKEASLKKKQIIVALLLVGLIVAVLSQPNKDSDGSQQIVENSFTNTAVASTNAVVAPQVPSSPVDAAESADTRIQRFAHVRELSRIELSDIANLELLAPEPLRAQEEFVSEKNQQVRAVYGTTSRHAALLGDSILRRGQTLPQGGKILEVTTDGIQVAP